MSRKVAGQAVVALLHAAVEKFGRITAHNKDQVTAWVLKQVQEIDGPTVELPDPKLAATGDRD